MASRSSTAASGTGCDDVGVKMRSDRPAVVIGGLRRRRVEHRVAVKQRDLDEHRTRLFRAAPTHGAEYALGLAAAQIGRHPYAGFQSHEADDIAF